MIILNLSFSYVSTAKFFFFIIMVHPLEMVMCMEYVWILTTGNQHKEVNLVNSDGNLFFILKQILCQENALY